MIRRAFSMLEVVLALVMLSALAMAAVSWTTAMLRRQSDALTADSQARDILTFDRLLRTDLMNHDVTIPPMLRRQARLWISDGRLHVLTRDRGPAEAVYELREGTVTRTVNQITPDSQTPSSILIESTESMAFQLESTEQDPWAILFITLDLADRGSDEPMRLRFDIPAEWLR